MYQFIKAIIHRLPDQFPSWHQLGVKLVEYIFQVVSFCLLFGVEEAEEFLHELVANVDLEDFHVEEIADYELQKELINALEVGPGRIDFFLLLQPGVFNLHPALLYVRQRPEEVLLYHFENFRQARDYQILHISLIKKHLLEIVDGV
eukprot:CAMPEP_0202961482 /NCGR_PEP_ID=MMETSP1396-20130829/5534_1 /ASSEMBLY_ACC=CAM_ASM_000872 /TAXON_ID= /ORGANISM="Pseudokeronopsis sp., Strain Brazil" /LENGTH=146 /DNA_ID=CAMNT_0049681325 /DNA_START=839 /DNA_END=1279 /DNA_ORIENTATION=-